MKPPSKVEELPVLSGQHINDPTERSVFKLLLTGIDDSAVVEVADRKTFRTSTAAKVEVVSEMIEATESELAAGYPDVADLPEQEKRLDETFATAQAEADAAQESIRALLGDKRRIGNQYAEMERRMGEVDLISPGSASYSAFINPISSNSKLWKRLASCYRSAEPANARSVAHLLKPNNMSTGSATSIVFALRRLLRLPRLGSCRWI